MADQLRPSPEEFRALANWLQSWATFAFSLADQVDVDSVDATSLQDSAVSQVETSADGPPAHWLADVQAIQERAVGLADDSPALHPNLETEVINQAQGRSPDHARSRRSQEISPAELGYDRKQISLNNDETGLDFDRASFPERLDFQAPKTPDLNPLMPDKLPRAQSQELLTRWIAAQADLIVDASPAVELPRAAMDYESPQLVEPPLIEPQLVELQQIEPKTIDLPQESMLEVETTAVNQPLAPITPVEPERQTYAETPARSPSLMRLRPTAPQVTQQELPAGKNLAASKPKTLLDEGGMESSNTAVPTLQLAPIENRQTQTPDAPEENKQPRRTVQSQSQQQVKQVNESREPTANFESNLEQLHNQTNHINTTSDTVKSAGPLLEQRPRPTAYARSNIESDAKAEIQPEQRNKIADRAQKDVGPDKRIETRSEYQERSQRPKTPQPTFAPQDARDRWPALPDVPQSDSLAWDRQLRGQERRRRLDREQRGDQWNA